jgi:hypothetical protein
MNNRREIIRERQVKLKGKLIDAIDNYCIENEYDISYVEIQQVLINLMNEYNSFPFKELMNSKE